MESSAMMARGRRTSSGVIAATRRGGGSCRCAAARPATSASSRVQPCRVMRGLESLGPKANVPERAEPRSGTVASGSITACAAWPRAPGEPCRVGLGAEAPRAARSAAPVPTRGARRARAAPRVVVSGDVALGVSVAGGGAQAWAAPITGGGVAAGAALGPAAPALVPPPGVARHGRLTHPRDEGVGALPVFEDETWLRPQRPREHHAAVPVRPIGVVVRIVEHDDPEADAGVVVGTPRRAAHVRMAVIAQEAGIVVVLLHVIGHTVVVPRAVAVGHP